MTDPMGTIEVSVEQRLVGLYSATKTLKELSKDRDGRKVIGRPKCIEEIELVRDVLSRILDDVGGK